MKNGIKRQKRRKMEVNGRNGKREAKEKFIPYLHRQLIATASPTQHFSCLSSISELKS